MIPKQLRPGQLSGESRATRMLRGIVKAAVIIGIAVMVDQLVADGTYTDATLSMLRQIEHSFQ
jgi:hypothetical protein